MERRWPWKKKKSSDKAVFETAATETDVVGSIPNQENYKKPSFVQISVESYTHFTVLENQVKIYQEQFQTLESQKKTYEDRIQTMESQVRTYEDRFQTMDSQVKTYVDQFQTLENQIEELNEKLSQAWSEVEAKENKVKQHAKVAEDAIVGWEKAETEVIALQSQVDSLKLSKRAAEDRATHLDSSLKEYMQQIRIMKNEHAQELHDKTKQWDDLRRELETKIENLEQQLLVSDAESAALSRSLQERGNVLVQINEEKSQAEAEIEYFKGKFESCEREVSSLKYELHVASKELEIRTEEKNMAIKSADVANKQYLEGVKKITKLDAECQRLRSLVRKKLPGPAALAQMRLEVETLGHDSGNNQTRRSSNPSSPLSPLPELNFDNSQKSQKDNEFLKHRMLAMEEEMKMLKEALAKRNSELQLSRDVCAKTASRLRSLEAQLQCNSKNSLNTRSVNSMSDDGIEDLTSCADSWTTASISELAQSKKDKSVRSNKSGVNQLELMDDFLEMEKLAHTSTESNRFLAHPANELESRVKLGHPYASGRSISSVNETSLNDETDSDQSSISELRTRILSVFESLSADSNIVETVESLKHILQSIPQIDGVSTVAKNLSSHNSSEILDPFSEDLGVAISQIHDFVLFIGNEIRAGGGSSGEVIGLIEKFSKVVGDCLRGNCNLGNIIVELGQILFVASSFRINILASSSSEGETNGYDCVDKVALPENKTTLFDTKKETYTNGFLDITDNLSSMPLDELKEIKSEKDRLLESLEDAKSQLLELEKIIAELKSQLEAAERSNSLAETQLRCMTESYRLLEKHAKELETEVECLKEKTKASEIEIQEQMKINQNTSDTCRYLQEQLERKRDISASLKQEPDHKMQQEIELVAAAEKLAKCQETISLLGKQFESMRPQPEILKSSQREGSQGSGIDKTKEGAVACHWDQAGCDPDPSTLDMYIDSSNSEASTLPSTPATTSSSKLPRHRHTMSGSSLSSTPTPEKYTGASFRRMFTSKRNI